MKHVEFLHQLKNLPKQSSQRTKFICVSIILLLLFSGCNVIMKPKAVQPPFSFTPENYIFSVSPSSKWEIYDVNALSWSPDESMFAVAGKGDKSDIDLFHVYTYKVNTFAKIWGSEIYIPFGLVYSPDSSVIAVPYSSGIRFLDATKGNIVKKIAYRNGCFGDQDIKYNPSGSQIFTLDTNPDYEITRIYTWDIQINKCLGTFVEEKGVAFDFEISGKGNVLVLGLRDIKVDDYYEQQVHVWDVETRKQVCSFKGVQPVSLALDGKVIAAGSIDEEGDVGLWDVKTCQLLDTIRRQEQKSPFSMDLSPDGKLLAIGGSKTFQIWDVASKKLLFESERLPNTVKILAFSPSGKYLLSETERMSVDDKAIITLWAINQ